jgi:hypothetical protein
LVDLVEAVIELVGVDGAVFPGEWVVQFVRPFLGVVDMLEAPDVDDV